MACNSLCQWRDNTLVQSPTFSLDMLSLLPMISAILSLLSGLESMAVKQSRAWSKKTLILYQHRFLSNSVLVLSKFKKYIYFINSEPYNVIQQVTPPPTTRHFNAGSHSPLETHSVMWKHKSCQNVSRFSHTISANPCLKKKYNNNSTKQFPWQHRCKECNKVYLIYSYLIRFITINMIQKTYSLNIHTYIYIYIYIQKFVARFFKENNTFI